MIPPRFPPVVRAEDDDQVVLLLDCRSAVCAPSRYGPRGTGLAEVMVYVSGLADRERRAAIRKAVAEGALCSSCSTIGQRRPVPKRSP